MQTRSRLPSAALGIALIAYGCAGSATPVPTAPLPTQPPIATATTAPTSAPPPTATPQGTVILVTSVDDIGAGTLRAALLRAQPGDTITFDPAIFPPSSPVVIAPLTPFGLLTQGHITIDASDAGVILDGKQVRGNFKSGLEIQSNGNVVRGLHVVNFPGPGIGISSGRDNLIEGNILGRNELGLGLWGKTTAHNRIIGNYVGVLADSVTRQENSGAGIQASEGAHDNFIGPGNVIAFNSQSGVEILDSGSTANMIFENSIHDNGGEGISLGAGANEDLPAPAISDSDFRGGRVRGLACPNCEVLIYSDAGDEGSLFEGRTLADEQGEFLFEKGFAFNGPGLTATAIDASGNTSRFSPPSGGGAFSIALQPGNGFPLQRLERQKTDELEDNGLSSLWSPRQPPFENIIEGDLVPLGLKRVRLQFNEGEYISTGGGEQAIDWSRPEWPIPEDMVGVVPLLNSHGITVDYVLIFWDKANHPDGWKVFPRFQTEDEIINYLDFVENIVTYFKGKVQYYELWNEPHMQEPLQYITSDDYVRVAQRAIERIHQIDPDAKVSVGAAVTRDPESLDYFMRLLNSDLMQFADVISWHPFYGDYPGGGRDPNYYANYPSLLDRIMTTAEEHGFKGEYIADEVTFTGTGCVACDPDAPYTELMAVKYTARLVLLHRARNVIVGIGNVDSNRALHYTTLRNLANVLAGATAPPLQIQGQVQVQVEPKIPNLKVVVFDRSDGSKLIGIWTDGPAVDRDPGVPATISIPGYADWEASGIDVLNGFEQQLMQDGHAGLLTISNFLVKDYPILIHLKK